MPAVAEEKDNYLFNLKLRVSFNLKLRVSFNLKLRYRVSGSGNMSRWA